MQFIAKIIFFWVCAIFFIASAKAETTDPMVQRVENYFNNLSTYQAYFRQVNETQGLVQEGNFYLKRPRQFLWQYQAPHKQKVVSTGSRMFYVDEESQQVTQLPLNSGLAAVLTQKKMAFKESKLQLLQSEKSTNGFGVTFQLPEEDGLQGGTMTLRFQENPLQLAQMVTTTPLGQKTLIDFYDVVQGQPLTAGLFDYTPPQEEIIFGN
ncbi:MAG: outer membrane lipoprotein carrier protein LolA [Alphaproteobacteria bacterium]|nr:outer membrane lipoprotein carrier protein LolA [Alphaproteobacteria bacterium]MDD9919593.1 outer membrane lipoprotein carrier protein LolA [Alphaproteobacteria bacterium]